MVNVVVNPVNTVNVKINQNNPKAVAVQTPASPGSISFVNEEYIAQSGQSLFLIKGGYVVGQISVYVNGVLLSSTDYNATDGTSVILNSSCNNGDIFIISKWSSTNKSPTVTSQLINLQNVSISSNNLTTSSNTTNQTLDSFNILVFRSAKYIVQVTSGSEYQTSEITLVHDGINAYVTEYGLVCTGETLMSYDSDINNGFARLLMNPIYNINNINVYKTYTSL